MGKFLQFLKEDPKVPVTELNIQTVNLNDPATMADINVQLAHQTSEPFMTPYIGLNTVMRVLAPYSIFLPKMNLDGESGSEYVEITQFGPGSVDSDDGLFFFYMEYAINDDGYFDIFAEVVAADDLDSLIGDDSVEVDSN